MSAAVCPKGKEKPNYTCRFCYVRLHSGSSECGCSTHRVEVTYYASLCLDCADALDVLTANTTVGRIHRDLVQRANMAGRPSGD